MDDDSKIRRMVDLDVKEVSLVDRPAIRRKFVVIKRINNKETNMGAFATEDKEKKATPEEEEEIEGGKKPEEKKEKAEPKEEKEKAMNPKAIAGMLRGLKGAPKGAVDALVGFLEGEKKAEPKDEYPSPKAKSESENLVVVKNDGSVLINAEVTKGRKAFTEDRTTALKETFLTLGSMLSEVDPEACKAVMEQMKALPSSAKVDSAVRPAPVKKSERESELEGELAEVVKRLEEIEKTREVSKSAGEGETDKPEEKEKSFWKGIL